MCFYVTLAVHGSTTVTKNVFDYETSSRMRFNFLANATADNQLSLFDESNEIDQFKYQAKLVLSKFWLDSSVQVNQLKIESFNVISLKNDLKLDPRIQDELVATRFFLIVKTTPKLDCSAVFERRQLFPETVTLMKSILRLFGYACPKNDEEKLLSKAEEEGLSLKIHRSSSEKMIKSALSNVSPEVRYESAE